MECTRPAVDVNETRPFLPREKSKKSAAAWAKLFHMGRLALCLSVLLSLVAPRAAEAQNVALTPGIISTVAGIGTGGFSGDGSAATGADLYLPSGVAFDSAGNLYIADYANNRIRVVNRTGATATIAGVAGIAAGAIATVAGNGTAGSSGDGGAAISAELYGPTGVALDGPGGGLSLQRPPPLRDTARPPCLRFRGRHLH